MFAVLTDGKYERFFDKREIEMIRSHIPWTRIVAEARTEHGGSRIDLVPFIEKNREHLVLKPREGYGGHGVFIGCECTPSEWADALGAALSMNGSYCVQELIEVPESELPKFSADGSLDGYEKFKCNLCLWSHEGRLAGVTARMSQGYVTNVAAGGALVPVAVVN